MSKPSAVKLDDLLEVLRENETNLSNYGFCLACGAQHDNCEPDARGYECEDCSKRQVYGAEEILLMGAYVE